MVKAAVEAIGGIESAVKPGSRVLIKPNVGFNRVEAVTSPEVLRALIEVVKEAGPADIIVAESAVRGYDTSSNFDRVGISEVARELSIRLIDLNKVDRAVKVKMRGRILQDVSVFKQALDADVIIGVPRLKRHSQAVVTISLKNMMGIFKPDLAIVDATEVVTVSGPGM